jgi:hypothetical protein
LVVALAEQRAATAEASSGVATGVSATSDYTVNYRAIFPAGRAPDFGTLVMGDAQGEHRFFFDTKRGLYYGYDLQIKKAADGFLLTLGPFSAEGERKLREMWPRICPGCPDPRPVASTRQRFPPPHRVAPGERIVVELLADEKSGEVVSEELTIVSPNATREAPEPQDFRAEAVMLHVEAPMLEVPGSPVPGAGAGAPAQGILAEGSVRGPVVWLSLPGRGRAFISLVPRSGYAFRKMGIVSGNRLRVTLDGTRYEWRTRGDIVTAGNGAQAWNLWVLHDLAFKPANEWDVLGGGLDERLRQQR